MRLVKYVNAMIKYQNNLNVSHRGFITSVSVGEERAGNPLLVGVSVRRWELRITCVLLL